jgi:phasin family protein
MPESLEQTMSSIIDQNKGLYEPILKFNTLLISNLEKMSEFQINAFKSYSDMGLNQLKQAAEVTDADSVREYTARQTELMSTFSQHIMEDTKAMTDMTMQFQKDVGQIFEETQDSFGDVAAAGSKEEKTSSTRKTST